DGGCHGNPGPGAWAFVIQLSDDIERSGGELQTTNNRMELQAVIEALLYIVRQECSNRAVNIHTDSQYVRNGITTWIRAWLRNGWKTAARKPVKNQDLWVRLHELDERVQPVWKWVRGHAGNTLNERCDQLVQNQLSQLKSQD
ncbi:MAG: ribonuclease HI, partial [Spirochaetales bacterium]|nr:ribonuclease HI [Spirochaetales bacterium]